MKKLAIGLVLLIGCAKAPTIVVDPPANFHCPDGQAVIHKEGHYDLKKHIGIDSNGVDRYNTDSGDYQKWSCSAAGSPEVSLDQGVTNGKNNSGN